MVSLDVGVVVFRKMSADEFLAEVRDGVDVNVVGHYGTDELLRKYVSDLPQAERKSVKLGMGDKLLLMQYKGGRLPVGAELNDVWLEQFEFFVVALATGEEVARDCDMIFSKVW
jgi:hypothetical protein